MKVETNSLLVNSTINFEVCGQTRNLQKKLELFMESNFNMIRFISSGILCAKK